MQYGQPGPIFIVTVSCCVLYFLFVERDDLVVQLGRIGFSFDEGVVCYISYSIVGELIILTWLIVYLLTLNVLGLLGGA